MSELKDLLDQTPTPEDFVREVQEKCQKVWKQDIRQVAGIISNNMHDPEILLKTLARYVQQAREDGYTPMPWSSEENQMLREMLQ